MGQLAAETEEAAEKKIKHYPCWCVVTLRELPWDQSRTRKAADNIIMAK